MGIHLKIQVSTKISEIPLLVENSSVVYEELREKLYQVDIEDCQSEPRINSYSNTRSFSLMSKIPLS